MEAINCKEISFTYPETEYPALKNVSFSLSRGEFCLLAGQSASGKSTLLKLLKKEISPAGKLEGALEINGSAGYVSQNIEESIVCDKVRSELSFGLENMGMSAESIELLVAETASYFNLESRLDDEISNLSGGEKQLVNLASVMIMKPDILLLDEPCSQLDPVWSERFISMLCRLHSDFNITVLISEHNTEQLYSYSDSIMLLDNSNLLLKASPLETAEFLKREKHPMLDFVPVKLRYNGGECKNNAPFEYGEKALEAKNLCFAYEKGNNVLYRTNFTAYKGKINAVIGANGSGKTTLLKTLAGVNKKYRGSVKASGKISMLCQNVYNLFTKDICSEEVTFGEITDFLGIEDIRDKHPYDLSGGQAQRLALAKVIDTNADIFLLDEPTQGLDCVLKKKLAELLREFCRQGKTVVIVSHDIEFIGAYSDYVSFLSRGKIVASAPRKEFFSSLNFYTTALSRITGGKVISTEDTDD